MERGRSLADRAVSGVGVASGPEDLAASAVLLDRARAEFESGHRRLADSVAIRAAAILPGVGHQRSGALRLAIDARDASEAGRDVIEATVGFTANASGQGPVIPVDQVRQLGDDLETARRELSRVTRGRRSLWGPLGDARESFDLIASDATGRLERAVGTARTAVTFTGGEGRRRLFLAGLNNAEMRAQGMVLSYAVVVADGGNLVVERSGSIDDLEVDGPVNVELPVGTAHAFSDLAPREQWRSVNSTADFSTAGRLMAALFHRATGERIDGVIAVDAPALAAVLGEIGPVRAPQGEEIDAKSAVPYLLSGQYRGIPLGAPQDARRDEVAGLGRAVIEALGSRTFDRVSLAKALGRIAGRGHVRFWSEAPEEQETFLELGVSGGPADAPTRRADRMFHVSVQDATATKVDFFVRTDVRFDVTLTEGNRAVVRTTVTVVNEAPDDAPRSYAFGPTPATRRPGEYRARVYLWGPTGSDQPDSVEESGLLLTERAVDVDPGDSTEVRFETIIDDAIENGRFVIDLVPQPRHSATGVQIRVVRADGDLVGTQQFDLRAPRTVAFRAGVGG